MSNPPSPTSDAERERAWLAPYAMHGANSAGRLHAEPAHSYRSPYQRDRDRIIHSAAFRRLAFKTQVFMGAMGDYHRTRLTHTLEVASIARTLARALRLNEDLVEALALAHDIGHPPFGHTGEEVLDECTRDVGGFNHNGQALRIFEILETRYPEFPGLNLTREVLAGQAHRVDKTSAAVLLEVQLVDAADSLAYVAHDADDALQLGLLEIEDLNAVPLWRDLSGRVRERYGELEPAQFRRAAVRQLIDELAGDLLTATAERLGEQGIASQDDLRRAGTLVYQSEEVALRKRELQAFLFDHVYRHPQVLAEREVVQRLLREMFAACSQDLRKLPEQMRHRIGEDDPRRVVADYLAGMTDRFATEQHAHLVG